MIFGDRKEIFLKLIPCTFLMIILLLGSSSIWGQPPEVQNPEGWQPLALPIPHDRLFILPPETLISQSLSIDLISASTAGIIADATLILNTQSLDSKSELVFYLNPGLKIESLQNQNQQKVNFKCYQEEIHVQPLFSTENQPYLVLNIRYRGKLASHSLFEPRSLSNGTLTKNFCLLPSESLWYPWFPGQVFTGRLQVKTPPGHIALSSVGEEKIIERQNLRTTTFNWMIPLRKLILAAAPWYPMQFERGDLTLELLMSKVTPERRNLLSTLAIKKVDFYSSAFCPLPWQRLTLVGRPNNAPAADGQGLIVLDPSAQGSNLLDSPTLDRLIARQWMNHIIHFAPDDSETEQGWVEFAARHYLNETFEHRAEDYWKMEGEWNTRLSHPRVPRSVKIPWILRMTGYWIGRPAFWELNQEFFQRHVYQQVTMEDYLTIAEEILYEEPTGPELRRRIEPWLKDSDIPILAYSSEILSTTPTRIQVTVLQQTDFLWELEIDLLIQSQDIINPNLSQLEHVFIKEAQQTFTFEIPFHPAEVTLDPDWKILCKRTPLKGTSSE